MWRMAVWMGHSVRLELTLAGVLVKLANHYTTRGAQHSWRSKGKLLNDVVMNPFPWTGKWRTFQQELLYRSSVPTQDVVWKTCLKRWMIVRERERERERERVRKIRTNSMIWWWSMRLLIPCPLVVWHKVSF